MDCVCRSEPTVKWELLEEEVTESHLGQYFTEDLHIIREVSGGLQVFYLEVATQGLYDVPSHIHRVRLNCHLSQKNLANSPIIVQEIQHFISFRAILHFCENKTKNRDTFTLHEDILCGEAMQKPKQRTPTMVRDIATKSAHALSLSRTLTFACEFSTRGNA